VPAIVISAGCVHGGAEQFFMLIRGQPQHHGQPVQRPPSRPGRPALLDVLQRTQADPCLNGQLPLS
jgi:hypothetical protein